MLTPISEKYLKPCGKTNRSFVRCKCDCGNEIEVLFYNLKNGNSKSCGCLQKEKAKILGSSKKKHGLSKHPLYHVLRTIKSKCYNNNNRDYSKNGGIGIKVCDEWHLFENFYNWAINNGWKNGLCLIRLDLTKDYFPENCKFITIAKQNFNKTAKVYNDKSLTDWAYDKKISLSCMQQWVARYGYENAIKMDKYQSSIEFKLEQILIKNNIQYIKNHRIGSFKPDFVIPDHNLVIECNGLYWHSDAINKDRNYHKNKQLEYSNHQYKSLFFNEDEILNKSHIIDSIILNKIGISSRIFARKCNIRKVAKNEAKVFLDQNHLMGHGKGDTYGLYLNGNLMTIIQVSFNKGIIDISRFCHKINILVIGGFSKLLTYIESVYKPNLIKTFIDKRYGCGNYLLNLDFELINEHLSFKWVKGYNVKSRQSYFSNSGYEYGFHKLWDCGQKCFIKKVSNG